MCECEVRGAVVRCVRGDPVGHVDSQHTITKSNPTEQKPTYLSSARRLGNELEQGTRVHPNCGRRHVQRYINGFGWWPDADLLPFDRAHISPSGGRLLR